jgi:hypothetical protein
MLLIYVKPSKEWASRAEFSRYPLAGVRDLAASLAK